MYKEKVDALLKEAFEATKKLLKENGEKTCVFSDESDLDVMTDEGEYCTLYGVRLAKGGQDPYGGWRTLEVFRSYIDGCGWCDSNDIEAYNYADLYDFVAENLNNAITYEESENLE